MIGPYTRDSDRARYRAEFAAITRSDDTAERLILLITATAQSSLWRWVDIAEQTRSDLLHGKSIEQIILWFADIVREEHSPCTK